MIYNHYASKMSELDMQIIHFVPQGGNWKNIPTSVPSKRLEQIRESFKEGKGSRSTYYGRLKEDMPAYTISTYFTRPGNGCNIHYNQDRTLTQREAARLQSFPDSFEFLGNKTAICNQIGNAVPPLLAYQIANALPFKGMCIDLFSGAGGLALGFTWAGWKIIVSNDIDHYALQTHKRNIPGGEIIEGDITTDGIAESIIDIAMKAKHINPKKPLFVIGGPPCQGFSTANTRRGTEDQRNWLFKSYIRIVEAIKPDGFIFENVTGILNLNGGDFFKMIRSELKASVEDIIINKINCAHYGIPQRRERIIILGGAKEIINSFVLQPITCIQNDSNLFPLPKVVSVQEALGDLPSILQNEDGSCLNYKHPSTTPYQAFMRGEISPKEYLDSVKNLH